MIAWGNYIGWNNKGTGNTSGDLPFISRWTTNVGSGGSNTDQVQLPLIGGNTYDMVVDWGDGTSDTITSYNQAETLHTYSSIGTYTITMTGTNGGFRFDNGGDKAKINQISQWGTLDISNPDVLEGCANLDVTATDAPIISSTNHTKHTCLLYTSPSPRDRTRSRMPSSA